MKLFYLLLAAAVLLAARPVVAQDTSRAPDPASLPAPLLAIDRFDYAFDAWEHDAITTERGTQRIVAKTGKGGFGRNIKLDLAAHAEHTPAVILTLHPENQMRHLRLFLTDADGTRAQFSFDLRRVPIGEPRLVLPQGAAALSQPTRFARPGDVEGLDLAAITQWQVQGDWRNDAVAVSVASVVSLAPDDAIRDMRAREEQRRADEMAQEKQRAIELAQRREQLLRDPQRTEASPTVERVDTVAPHIVGLDIQAGRVTPMRQVPYEQQPGDQIKREGEAVLLREGDRFVVGPRDRLLLRPGADGKPRRVGELLPEHGLLLPDQRVVGDALEPLTVDEPAAYLISSDEDDRFAAGVRPQAVHRKSKPNDHAMPTREPAMRHRLYLVLPHALREGAAYRIQFVGLTTREPHADFTHLPRQNRSEAIHVSHIGFTPGDPFKRAYLSVWMGTGGGLRYADLDRFELLDSAGQTVFTQEPRRAHAIGDIEKLRTERDNVQAEVYHLDFHGFDTPGTYRVHVPGVGVSYPFTIADGVWTEAFTISMQGFLNHRSGVALGPPLTPFIRPQSFHPDMGLTPWQTDVTTLDGESKAIDESLRRLSAQGELTAVPEAWGGYMDAGDWDRRTPHLRATYLLLELVDLFPTKFAALPLNVPEAGDAIPDLLDEALWNLAFFRRLQQADGGVRGGVESTSHPRAGETSWQETLPVGVFAADPMTSYLFAGAAAKASRLLRPYDAGQAEAYAESAARAWRWAEANRAAFEARIEARKLRSLPEDRTLAAIELFRVTGDRAYHDAAAAWLDEALAKPGSAPEAPLFAYAILPQDSGDAPRKQAAREAIVQQADRAIAFGQGNSYNLTTHATTLPMMGYVGYFSVPGMVGRVLPRAHYLTGEQRFLTATIMACQFSAGANPDNMAYTTGLGPNPPRNPLHIDARRTGQPAPAGITVYGPSDPAEAYPFNDWVHTWFLSKQKTPDSRTWPPHEAYTDIYLWPAMCEYTITQTIAPTAYYWGYLAARD